MVLIDPATGLPVKAEPKKASSDQLPLFMPDSNWKPLQPADWPDLSYAKYIGVDTETHDLKLDQQGPGFIRGDAYVCGVSFATDHHKFYLPTRHADGNLDPDAVARYTREQVSRTEQTKVFANAPYDLEALWSIGATVFGPVVDIQVAEPLLDEDREAGYSLDSLALDYLGQGKDEVLLDQAAAALGEPNAKKIMSRVHSSLVGPYAELDPDLTLRVFMLQLKKLERERLMPVFNLESELTPILWAMRLRGVKVDLDYFERTVEETKAKEATMLKQLRDVAGKDFNPGSGDDIADVLKTMGVQIPYTKPTKPHPNGVPSVRNEWLASIAPKVPWAMALMEYRRTLKMRRDFMEGQVLEQHINGRVHCQWHQLREGDDAEENEGGGRKDARGTRTGRIASSNPCLTQVPTRNPVWGPIIRKGWVPDDGLFWFKRDYNQQEPRNMIHFAYLKSFTGADEARAKFIADRGLDYHTMVQGLIYARTGDVRFAPGKPGRAPAKEINLGSSYGMGVAKLALKLGISIDAAKDILKAYHAGVPFVKAVSKAAQQEAKNNGYVRTILGRKRRFKMWCKRRKFGDEQYVWEPPVRTREAAVALWGEDGVERDGIFKAINAKVQGSSADQMKTAIVKLARAGLTPQIQIYDELNGSYANDPAEVHMITEIMEHAIDFEVPHIASPKWGPNWGELKEWKEAA